MTKPRVTLMVDASSIRESACILRLYRIVVQGYRTEVMPNDVTYGTAFHHFRKQHTHGKGVMASLNEAVELYKTIPKYVKRNKQYLTELHLRKTCLDYINWWETMEQFEPLRDHEGVPLVEQKFAVPILIDTSHPDIDVEVLGCGTIDYIGKHTRENFLVVKDYKTTSVWDVKKYLGQYRLSTQLMFYVYILKQYGKFFPDGIIGKIAQHEIGAFVDGIFLASEKDSVFERSEVYFYSAQQLAEFEKGIMIVIHRLVEAVKNPAGNLYKEGTINSSCEKVYGACSFFNACSAPDSESEQMILDGNYTKKPYNPLKFDEQ